MLQSQPASIQLRYLQTLTEIGVERNTVIVFPMPIDMMQQLIDLRDAKARGSAPAKT